MKREKAAKIFHVNFCFHVSNIWSLHNYVRALFTKFIKTQIVTTYMVLEPSYFDLRP